MTQSMRVLAKLAFSILLLAGAYSPAFGQQADTTDAPQMEMGSMMEMMEMMRNCPMMQENAEMAQMMKDCPMMKDGGMDDESAMGDASAMHDAMRSCPMMKQMMEHCPMMHGQMNGHMGHDAPHTSPAETTEGAREVNVTVAPMGYEPAQIELEAGVPARITFLRTEDGGCTHQIQSPALGIAKTNLPLNEPVSFEVTPEEAGAFTFVCGMDMMKGTIVVKS